MPRFLKLALSLILTLALFCCEEKQKEEMSQDSKNVKDDVKTGLNIQFKMFINRNVYIYSNFGEPPQIAIWLENPDTTFYQTVWVTHRAGKNDWKGKIECLVALPYWDLRRKAGRNSQELEEQLDGVTGATPKKGEFIATITVPENSRWNYFVEINTSGDYNENFPYWSDIGLPDSEENGQPSIVYSGNIIAQNGKTSEPKLIGHTDQRSILSTLNTDIDKITTAKRLVENIRIEVNN